MKKKTLVVVMLTVMGLVAVLAGIAQADWRTCTVSQVGSTTTAYLVQATDLTATPPIDHQTFAIDLSLGNAKEMYAAVLTAFANSTSVQIFVDAPYPLYGTIWGAMAVK